MTTQDSGSDPKHCGLCLQEGSKEDAKYYRENCNTYICDRCKASHSKFQELRHHTVVSTNTILSADSVELSTGINARFNQMFTKPSDSAFNPDDYSNSSTKPDEANKSIDASTKPSDSIVPSTRSTKPFDVSLQSDTAAEDKTNVLSMKTHASNRVDVRLTVDKALPNIKGCCCMPGGKLVLCDDYNVNIKILDNALSVKDSLTLPGSPRDVAAIDHSQVVVTLPVRRELQFINVIPSLKKLRAVSVDKRCQGVDVAAGQIFVSCYTYGKDDGEVRVYDINGNLKKKLGIKKDGSYMFKYPEYVVVNRSGDKLIVSDSYEDKVYCLTTGGKMLYQYSDKELSKPRGLYVDDTDSFIVCGRLIYNVQVITAAGKKYKTLLSSEDGIGYPECVIVRPSDGTLVVSSEHSDKLFVCKLL